MAEKMCQQAPKELRWLVFGRLFNVFQSFRKTTEATDNLKYTHMSC